MDFYFFSEKVMEVIMEFITMSWKSIRSFHKFLNDVTSFSKKVPNILPKSQNVVSPTAQSLLK